MEFERSAVNSAKTIVRLEAKCDQLQRENIDLKEEVMEAKRREEEMKEKMMEKCVKAKDKYKKVKEKFDLEERKWREKEEKIGEECRQLGVDKRKLEIDLEAATRSRADGGDDLAKKLKAAQDEVMARVYWLEEKDGKILFTQNESLVLTHRIQVLEDEKGQLEAELRKVKEDNRSKDEQICVLEEVKEAEKRAMEDEGKKEVSELTRRIGVLESLNRELEAKFCQVNTEKSEEINRILNEKTTMEAESKKKGLELVRRIGVFERGENEEIKRILNEKRTMEAESEVKVLELIRRIEELEKEKRANEAKVCQANKEKSEEICSILNEKTTMEMKVLELVQRIEVLERERREMEAEVCREKKEKSEEISRILNEKMAVEAEKTSMETESKKKALELVWRIEALKREIEAEVCEAKEKSEKIKRILNEKTPSQEKHEKRILEREKQGLEAETGNNDGVAQILVQEDQGSQSDDISVAEPNKESSIVDVEVRWHDEHVLGSELSFWGRACTRSQKRKIEALECSLANKARTKRCEADGLATEHGLI